jgi:hypothetical protein
MEWMDIEDTETKVRQVRLYRPKPAILGKVILQGARSNRSIFKKGAFSKSSLQAS